MSNKVFKISDMPKTGVFFGKFYPPTRGHLNAIINASTQVQKLYVVISNHNGLQEKLSKESNMPFITMELRKQWLAIEVIDMPHITVTFMDESNIPEYPNGWQEWTNLLRETVKEEIDMFFCGEKEYEKNLQKYFPNAQVTLFDTDRTIFPISATMIRQNPYKYWNFMLGSVRPFFAKKVLITGTESTGKTTLTKCLAKLYHTSWSEEYGRYYAERFLGGSEDCFTDEDFTRIAHLQVEQDYEALKNSNKICFFDTDAVVTNIFSELYVGHTNKIVESYINPNKYDVVFLLKPSVEWVDDGMRLNGEEKTRWEIYEKLRNTYLEYGFTVVDVEGFSYHDRLNFILNYIKENLGIEMC